MAEVGTALLKPVENIDLLVVGGAVNTELKANRWCKALVLKVLRLKLLLKS